MQNTQDTATNSLAFPARAPLADPSSVRYGYTGTTAPTGPAALSSYGLLSLSVSMDGRYVALAQPYAEDHEMLVLNGLTGQPAGRANGWYAGRACAIGRIAMDTQERRGQIKDEDGAPFGGWRYGILTTRNQEDEDGKPLWGTYHGGVFWLDGTRSEGLGPGNAWNEERPGAEGQSVQDRNIVDVALCRDDALVVFADATPDAPCLRLYDRARPIDPEEWHGDKYFDRRRGNTLLRDRAVIPLPALPLRVAPSPDGVFAWVILETEPRQVVKVSLES